LRTDSYGCAASKPPPHQKLAEDVLAAVQAGEITSYPERAKLGETDRARESLENVVFWQRWHFNVFSEQHDIEMGTLLSIGKITSYRLLSSEDWRWRITPGPTSFEGADGGLEERINRELARQGDADEKSGKPLLFGETRDVNARDVNEMGKRALQVDWLIGAKALEYSVETANTFYKSGCR